MAPCGYNGLHRTHGSGPRDVTSTTTASGYLAATAFLLRLTTWTVMSPPSPGGALPRGGHRAPGVRQFPGVGRRRSLDRLTWATFAGSCRRCRGLDCGTLR